MNMKRILLVLLGALAIVLTACHDGDKSSRAVSVRITMHHPLHRDSASLYVLDEKYHRVRHMATLPFADSTVIFTAHVEDATLAYLTFDTLSTPLYFVLEPCDISLDKWPHGWKIEGGKENNRYQNTLIALQHVKHERERLWNAYRHHANDSTLTAKLERQMARQDSVLNDSARKLVDSEKLRGLPAGQAVKLTWEQTLREKAKNK